MATSTLGSGTLVLAGTTSGTTTVTATAVAGTTTLTLPAATDTLVGKATTDTLTNKTLTGAAMNGTLGATTPSTVAATTLTTSSTVTHNGGTANGVAYLDGSKVLTTGSALVFNGTNLILGDTTADGRLKVLETAAGAGVTFYNSANNSAGQIGTTNEAGAANSLEINAYRGSGRIVFKTNNTYAASFDASGNLLVGTTSAVFPSGQSGMMLSRSSQPVLRIAEGSSYFDLLTTGDNVYINNRANGFMAFYTNSTERARIDSSGGLILAGSTAQKATGTTWSNPSDKRLKDNIRDYAKGTTELMQVRVREWEYNGKGGTTEGTKGLGVIADEVMTVLPDTVENYDAKLNADDEEVTAIKKFDATEITWLLVKTVQEQQALIAQLNTRITALESA